MFSRRKRAREEDQYHASQNDNHAARFRQTHNIPNQETIQHNYFSSIQNFRPREYHYQEQNSYTMSPRNRQPHNSQNQEEIRYNYANPFQYYAPAEYCYQQSNSNMMPSTPSNNSIFRPFGSQTFGQLRDLQEINRGSYESHGVTEVLQHRSSRYSENFSNNRWQGSNAATMPQYFPGGINSNPRGNHNFSFGIPVRFGQDTQPCKRARGNWNGIRGPFERENLVGNRGNNWMQVQQNARRRREERRRKEEKQLRQRKALGSKGATKEQVPLCKAWQNGRCINRCPRSFRHYYIEGERVPGLDDMGGPGRRRGPVAYTSPYKETVQTEVVQQQKQLEQVDLESGETVTKSWVETRLQEVVDLTGA